MATNEEITAATKDARLALLRAIAKNADGASRTVLERAEAYAWITNPRQPHTASAASKS